jgi:hypothetical protein
MLANAPGVKGCVTNQCKIRNWGFIVSNQEMRHA